ncbi:MAG: sigma-70 family RNA polymerase sigma factor [Deltaproteobacteria bacterium]|nr:sigma-70 family RNA polymerase sigma factor [Deltaproteobacteria bacterium]
MSDAEGDAELIHRLASGDHAALSQLYDKFAPSMLALGVRLLGDRKEAEDLLHDVFLEVWRSAADYDVSRGSVAAWLALRTRSRALDRLRSASRRRVVSWSDVRGSDLTIDGGADADLDRDKVRQRLAELPEAQREVILLSYYSGLSSSEIANTLSIPIGTVKSRTAGAIAKLRRGLGETA